MQVWLTISPKREYLGRSPIYFGGADSTTRVRAKKAATNRCVDRKSTVVGSETSYGSHIRGGISLSLAGRETTTEWRIPVVVGLSV